MGATSLNASWQMARKCGPSASTTLAAAGAGSTDRALRSAENSDVRLGDVRDAGLVMEAVRGVEIVLHLAALIAIPYSYVAPELVRRATNVTGTLNVLEAARQLGVERLVHTSTSEVYGTPDVLPIRANTSTAGAVTVRSHEGRGGPVGAFLGLSFGVPVGDPAAVEHVWP